ncbi:hypothetical protein QF032_000020 [Streptomyces achromogenes]|uniref:hypothetical protein n=1 Tax=Streptomyces achromogenes TaxID=67255 RepID=UPI00277EF80B|nr:hypothetical protein [Streptomyces achromogenes]MDQ0828176.1 hypothetical protein [Streptomyces achromogenes]
MPGWFRLDRTEGQERALYVSAEEDTLRQQLTGWLVPAGIAVLVVGDSARPRSQGDFAEGRTTGVTTNWGAMLHRLAKA